MIVLDPKKRYSAKQILAHPWFEDDETEENESIDPAVLMCLKNFKCNSTFIRGLLHILVNITYNDKNSDLLGQFEQFDYSKNKIITKSDLMKAFKLNNFMMSEHEIDRIITRVSFSSNGFIGYTDFIVATYHHFRNLDSINSTNISLRSPEIITSLFNTFDSYAKGYITRNDIKREFLKIGKMLSHEEITVIMDRYGTKTDYRLYIDDIQRILC